MTRSGRNYTPEELERTRKEKTKGGTNKPPPAPEPTLVKVLKKSDYDVVQQLKRTPANIDMFSLLESSAKHHEALMSALREVLVPKDISPVNLQNMIGRVAVTNTIFFTDDEIPDDGANQAKALHIAVKARGMIVSRVLIDNGSALNVCPFITLEKLGFSESDLSPSNMIVRAFDGTRRETMGEIELPIEIGNVTFQIRFQVLQIPSAYNFLLGRPWIHAIKSVPSSLHQKVKFVMGDKQLTIHAEKDFEKYPGPTIPVIEKVEPSSLQTLEVAATASPPHEGPVIPSIDWKSVQIPGSDTEAQAMVDLNVLTTGDDPPASDLIRPALPGEVLNNWSWDDVSTIRDSW
jgi:hypothetical protein